VVDPSGRCSRSAGLKGKRPEVRCDRLPKDGGKTAFLFISRLDREGFRRGPGERASNEGSSFEPHIQRTIERSGFPSPEEGAL